MTTTPEFDWDEVFVSKKPKQKEIDINFESDPGLTLGSVDEPLEQEVAIGSAGRPECGAQRCSAGDDFVNGALPYDVGTRTYFELDGQGFADIPAAIYFRIADTDNFPNPQVLDNYFYYNILVDTYMCNGPQRTKAPCENAIAGKDLKGAWFAGATDTRVAFYPTDFEDRTGNILVGGQQVTIRSCAGVYLYGRNAFGDTYAPLNQHGFALHRLQAWGNNSVTGNYDGANAGIVDLDLVTEVRSENNNSVELWSGFLDNQTSNPATTASAPLPLADGDYTGSYMWKLETVINMAPDGQSATGHILNEVEHVLSGIKLTQKKTFSVSNLNGGLKISSPWELEQNGTLGGMEGTSRYFYTNLLQRKTMYMIAYNGWDNESKVRQACYEFERSQPHWQAPSYCDRI
jgi:hypothetical protein